MRAVQEPLVSVPGGRELLADDGQGVLDERGGLVQIQGVIGVAQPTLGAEAQGPQAALAQGRDLIQVALVQAAHDAHPHIAQVFVGNPGLDSLHVRRPLRQIRGVSARGIQQEVVHAEVLAGQVPRQHKRRAVDPAEVLRVNPQHNHAVFVLEAEIGDGVGVGGPHADHDAVLIAFAQRGRRIELADQIAPIGRLILHQVEAVVVAREKDVRDLTGRRVQVGGRLRPAHERGQVGLDHHAHAVASLGGLRHAQDGGGVQGRSDPHHPNKALAEIVDC